MSDLVPRAFDIETTGLDPESTITVVGLATGVGTFLVLNTDGRQADESRLASDVESRCHTPVRLSVVPNEERLLSELTTFTNTTLGSNRYYLTTNNSVTLSGGFDLQYLRRACVRNDIDWPFPALAYADVTTMVQRFDTGSASTLEDVYDELIDDWHCDPFDDSEEAVAAYESTDWSPLLRHNVADVTRTIELATLAERYVPKGDFRMKSLTPPNS